MVSSKNIKININDYTQFLHRLNQAFNLGTRHEGKWQCSDIQIQRQVVRSASAFLESVAVRPDKLNHPNLKDTISDIVSALVWILDHPNATTSGMTVDATVKLFTVLPNSISKTYVVDLVSSLSSLELCHQTEVSKSWATALSLTISNVTSKNERVVWDILKKNRIVHYVIVYLKSLSFGTNPVDSFEAVVSLLTTILRRWPQSRFTVWSEYYLMRDLNCVFVNLDSCCEVELLRLFSAVALCGSGAMKLLESGESLIRKLVQCMDSSQPHSVQVEAFKLTRYLTVNEERFSELMRCFGEPIVKAVILGMSKARKESGEVSDAEMSVATEACRLALITRYKGDHHLFFWKHGIGNVLLDLLSENPQDQLDQDSGSLENQFSISVASLNSNRLLVLRNYIWDILGWLAIHCKKRFNPEENGNKFSIDLLISSACSASMDAIHKRNKICQINIDDTLRSESATRAVLLMIYSPCEYISSKASSVLSESLTRNGKENLKHFLSSLKYMSSRNSFDRRQITIYVMALTSYIGIPEPRNWVIEFSGLKVLITLVTWCLSNDFEEVKKLSLYSCSRNSFCGETCCDVSSEDWDGKDTLLFYSLWGLAESINHLKGIENAVEISSGGIKYRVKEIVKTLCEICIKTSTPGVGWVASYALSSLGLYGFPCKFAKRIGKVLSETGLSDTKLVLKTGEILSVHGVVLAIRCPSLLGLNKPTDENSNSEIRLSRYIGYEAMLKFMDFVYFGYLSTKEEEEEVEEEELTRLLFKTLAKFCNLSLLFQSLSRQRPKWGSPLPRYDLSLALGPLGHRFSDVILETKATELPNWKCNFCASSVPHMHVHKAILEASCDYFRALFNSGLQESLSETVKLDLSWGAMSIVIAWFYTDAVPKPPKGCLWDNLSAVEKFREIEPYLELCSVSKSWLLEDVEQACSNVIVSCLESESQLCLKIIVSALDFSLWNLVEVGINHAAPKYRQLRESGELENLDEALVDMIRSASVQYTQEGNLFLS